MSMKQFTTRAGGRKRRRSEAKKPPSSALLLDWPSDSDSEQNYPTKDTQLWVDKYAPRSSNEMTIPPKKMEEIRTWLRDAYASPTTASKFLVLTGIPGVGKSTAVQCLAREFQLHILSWEESISTTASTFLFSNNTSGIDSTSPIASFELFLQQCRATYNPLLSSHTKNQFKTLVLIENPSFHDHFRLQSILHVHASSTTIPTILIDSSSEESFSSSPSYLLSNQNDIATATKITTIHINKTTLANMKKVIQKIAKAENIPLPQKEQLQEYFTQLHNQSNGDIRNAIHTFQFEQNYFVLQNDRRDTVYSTFHALGKLLYAKRKDKHPQQINQHHALPPLDFDPELVLENTQIRPQNALSFLSYHSPDFFQDISNLSEAMSLFSDTAFLDHSFKSMNSREEQVIISIMSRTVASTNRKPCPFQFRKLVAPKITQVYRERNAKQLETSLSIQAYFERYTQLHTQAFIRDLSSFPVIFDKLSCSPTLTHSVQENDVILEFDDISSFGDEIEDTATGSLSTRAFAGTPPIPMIRQTEVSISKPSFPTVKNVTVSSKARIVPSNSILPTIINPYLKPKPK